MPVQPKRVVVMRSVLFFFLMIRRPPRSTLFPTRRSSDLRGACIVRGAAGTFTRLSTQLTWRRNYVDAAGQVWTPLDRKSTRPELQSRQYLVCRLLLEKKPLSAPFFSSPFLMTLPTRTSCT